MADYYPAISRAVVALDDKSKQARRAVCDRARTTLVDQLQKIDPPLSETDVEHERLALEDAISKVEADAVVSEVTRPIPDRLKTQNNDMKSGSSSQQTRPADDAWKDPFDQLIETLATIIGVPTIWFMRALFVCAFVAWGWLYGGPHMLLSGVVGAVVAIGLAALIGKLGKMISRKAPIAAQRVGLVFYWLGVTVAVGCLLPFAYMSYAAPSEIISPFSGQLVAMAFLYWAAGWGLRRALTMKG